MGRRSRKSVSSVGTDTESRPKLIRSRKHSYYSDCRKGSYHVINPDKYMRLPDTKVTMVRRTMPDGTEAEVPDIVVNYKSDWERRFCVLCDGNERVLKWAYEPFDIPYSSPVYMKQSLYKPDIYLEIAYDDGHVEKWLVEIKPVAYSVVPVPPKPLPQGCQDQKKIASYQRRMATYQRKSLDVATNYAKWAAAEAWCKRHSVNWMIFNEENTRGLFKGSVSV